MILHWFPWDLNNFSVLITVEYRVRILPEKNAKTAMNLNFLLILTISYGYKTFFHAQINKAILTFTSRINTASECFRAGNNLILSSRNFMLS